jgi:hypothetical protein
MPDGTKVLVQNGKVVGHDFPWQPRVAKIPKPPKPSPTIFNAEGDIAKAQKALEDAMLLKQSDPNGLRGHIADHRIAEATAQLRSLQGMSSVPGGAPPGQGGSGTGRGASLADDVMSKLGNL